MSIEEKIKKENDEPELIDFKLENEWGKFFIKEGKDGSIAVEIFNKDGEKFVVNNLLPDEWRILSYAAPGKAIEAKIVHEFKDIIISEAEVRDEGWQYLLSILHEIGHAVTYESDESEKEIVQELNRLEELLYVFPDDTKPIKRLEELQSKRERDVWAYAIRKFRKILNDLGIDQNQIFSSNQELKKYVNDFLLSYKEGGMRLIKGNKHFSDEEREELIEYIFKLYTKKK